MLLAAAAVAGCGEDGDAKDGGDAGDKDGSIGFGGADVQDPGDAGAIDVGGSPTDAGGAQDVAKTVDAGPGAVATVGISAPTDLELGKVAVLKVAAQTLTGGDADTAGATFTADGVALPVSAAPPADPTKQGPIALWPHDDKGSWWVASARAGEVEVIATVAGVASKPVKLKAAAMTGGGLRVSIPAATGQAAAERVLDDPNTIRMTGKAQGAGGGEFTLRLPASAKSGDVFDLDKPPAKGGLSFKGTLADLGGAKIGLAKGRFYVQKTTGGVIAGSFVGQDASLKPVVGAFVVARKGRFGIDLLDDGAVQLGKSDSGKPETGHHHSRLSLGALGKQALVLHRHIEGKLKAKYATALLNPVAGTHTPQAPLLEKIATYSGLSGGQPGPFNPGLGYAAVASNGDKHLLVWEGRSEKGHSKPHGLWARLFDAKLSPLTPILALDTDPCHGTCKPRAVSIPGSYAVFWDATDGGIRGRLVEHQLVDGKLKPAKKDASKLVAKGSDVSAAVHGKTVMLAWRTGDAARAAPWDSTKDTIATSAVQVLGNITRRPAVVAVTLDNIAPNKLFATLHCSGGKLYARSLTIAGNPIGPMVTLGDCNGDLLASGGQPGQAMVIEVVAGNAHYWVHAHKLAWAAYNAPVKQLGNSVELVKFTTGSFIVGAMTYVAAANAFAVGWSGDLDSAGVWIRRLR